MLHLLHYRNVINCCVECGVWWSRHVTCGLCRAQDWTEPWWRCGVSCPLPGLPTHREKGGKSRVQQTSSHFGDHFRWLSRLVRLPAMSSCKYFSSQAGHTVYKLMRRIQDRCSLVKSNKALGTISRVSFTFRATTKAVACIIIVATTSFSRDKTWAGTLLVPLSGICLHASCQTLTSRFIRLNPGIVILQSLLDFCGVHFK